MTAPDPDYQLKDGIQGNLNQKPDYVLIHLDSIIWQAGGNDTPRENIFRYPFDIRVLQREYQQVFSVKRAVDLKVASSWKRR